MKSNPTSYITLSLALVFAAVLVSCGSTRSSAKVDSDMRELARAGLRLGFDIEQTDNHALLLEASRWLGTPYRYGGNDRNGVDCSGLTKAIYSNVYNYRLHRNSRKQYEQDCEHVKRTHLRSGDLLFFGPKGKSKNINHVGIFLKEDFFIHASSTSGVRVSSLEETYFQKNFVSGGRVKHLHSVSH